MVQFSLDESTSVTVHVCFLNNFEHEMKVGCTMKKGYKELQIIIHY